MTTEQTMRKLLERVERVAWDLARANDELIALHHAMSQLAKEGSDGG